LPHWQWTLKNGTLEPSINATTVKGTEGALTTFDLGKLQTASSLSLARTIIHELVHAYLLVYFKHEGLNAREEYPQVMEAWSKSKKPDLNKIHHQVMETVLIGDIAAALKEFSDMYNVPADRQLLMDVAWGGLDYRKNRSLSKLDKARIQKTILGEQNGAL